MVIQLTPAPADDAALAAVAADVQAAKDLADAADAKAANARSMVLTRDPRLTALETDTLTLKTVAATVGTLSEESTADRLALHQRDTELTSQIAALANTVAGLTPHVTTMALGCRPVGALALNGSTSVVVPLSRAMPTGYRIEWSHSAVVELAKVTVTEMARTSTSVTLTVKATGLALVAGTLVVAAVA